jgi:GT2 family glycosyltransferase/glycosyltransferase involved in cell wall biosynthesis
MTKNPLVSIVIPVYNGANYVAEAIESALAQTYSYIEVIVVDDGSTDQGATAAVVRKFEPHIRFLQKANGGVASALNTGIEAMNGELFSWLSHDDLYKPDKVVRQLEVFRSFPERCVVIGDFELMNEMGEFTARISLEGNNLIARPLDAVFRGLINGCALLVPRTLLLEAGKFEPGLPTTQDYHLWYRIARLAPFVHSPHSGVRQRVHALQGSKLASHLEEASRMFIYLIDSTPESVMQSYDGSAAGFMMKIRERLSAYPGLRAYLDVRIDSLMRQHPLAVVAVPPREKSFEASLRSAEAASAATIAFTPTSYRQDEVLAALQQLVFSDADIARPNDCSGLDYVIARRSALPAMIQAFSAAGWSALPQHVRVVEYQESKAAHEGSSLTRAVDALKRGSSFVSKLAIVPREVEESLLGNARVSFSSTSEKAVIRALSGLERARLPTVLFLLHSLGGGARRHLTELIGALNGKANCITGCGTRDGSLCLTFGPPGQDRGIVFRLPEHRLPLVRILQAARVGRVDVHSTYGFDGEAKDLLASLALPFDVTLTDYHLLASHPHLCFEDGRFVGDARLDSPRHGMLRQAPLPILCDAARVIAISRDMGARIERMHPGLPLMVARHWREATAMRVRHVFIPRIWDNEPLRILIAGRIAESKGRQLLIGAARLAARRKLPLRFHVLGQMEILSTDMQECNETLTVHGRYESSEFSERLCGIAPHVGWLPSLVPETWSYILTDLMEASLPLAGTALGAIPERCWERPSTWLLDWEAYAEEWVELFLKLHASRMETAPRWSPVRHLPQAEDFYPGAYLSWAGN